VRAIVEAACALKSEGIDALPEIMIPLISDAKELKYIFDYCEVEIKSVLNDLHQDLHYSIGTMIEIPRAALLADQIAEYAEFFSFGTNDLTQTTFGLSRDDSNRFLPKYIELKIYSADPFATLDKAAVGELMRIAIKRGKSARSNLKCGICGEHGGDPKSIQFCHELGLDYVSCSPYRVPVAKLAAAQATLKAKGFAKLRRHKHARI
jgi:pyruvate,orthophosphate dikinase